MKTRFIFFILLLNLSLAIGESEISEFKTQLEHNLINEYLPLLEEKLGPCSPDKQTCLKYNNQDDYIFVEMNSASICFPFTTCGFYSCMEKKFQCEKSNHFYFTKLALPTCQKYVKNIEQNLFSKKAIEWIYSVMVCLQKGLIDECELRGNCPISINPVDNSKTCEHITDFTLKFHPGCYLNSGVGICNLPLRDKINIWKTVGPMLTAKEKEEAYKVIFQCLKP